MSHKKVESEHYHSFDSYVDHNPEKDASSSEMKHSPFDHEVDASGDKLAKLASIHSADQRERTRSILSRVYSTKKYAKWFDITETKTMSKTSGSYTIYKIIYRVSLLMEKKKLKFKN